MAQDIMLSVGLETQDAEKQAEALDKEVKDILKKDSGTKDSKIASLDSQMVKALDTSKQLREQLASIREDTSVPSEDYVALSNNLQTYRTELESLVGEYNDCRYSLMGVNAQLEKLSKSTGMTEQYKNLKTQIEKVNTELGNQQNMLESLKGTDAERGPIYDKVANKIRTLTAEQEKLVAQQKEMEMSGKAFIDPRATQEYQDLITKGESFIAIQQQIKEKQANINSEISNTVAEMRSMQESGSAFKIDEEAEARVLQNIRNSNNQLAVAYMKHRDITKETNKTNKNLKETVKHLKKASGATISLGTSMKSINTFSKGILKKILMWGFGIRSLFILVRRLRSQLTEGFKDLYDSGQFTELNDKIDGLKGSLMTLRNAFVGAFAPIVETVIPYLQRFIEWLTKAVGVVAQFIAALMGKTTYLRAIKQSGKKAIDKEKDAIEDENDALEEQQRQLSGLDKLNVLTSPKDKKDKKKDKKKDEEAGIGPLFEEVPIDNKILDWLQKIKDFLKPILDYINKLRERFMEGFWDALGDWKSKLEDIKKNLKSIWDMLREIFTDPNVVGAADRWAQSFAYMLGALTGLLANIGLTAAQMLIGGFEKFLSSKKEDIKQWLVSMFDVGTEINEIWGQTFVALSRLVDVFGQENGQKLVAGIMSIAYELYSNILLLGMKLFRDISNILTLWIRENQEKLAQMINDILGWGADILNSIQQLLDDVLAHAQQVYDEHIKPLFDTIAQYISDIISELLDIYNSEVKPFLDQIGVDIDEMLNTYIGPTANSILDIIGSLADGLKMWWNATIKPLMDSVLTYLKIFIPAVQVAWTTVSAILELFLNSLKFVFEMVSGILKALVKLLQGDFKGALDEGLNVVKLFKDTMLKDLQILKTKGKQILDGIVRFFTNAWNTIKSKISSILSGTEKVNSAMSSTNTASNTSRYKAPGAATGAVIPPQMSQRVFTVGDNNSETEVISPLSTMQKAMVNALQEAGLTNNSNSGDIVINIDGREVFRVVQTQANQYSNQHGGRSAFAGA